jgi:hypothetical protein
MATNEKLHSPVITSLYPDKKVNWDQKNQFGKYSLFGSITQKEGNIGPHNPEI